MKRKKLWSVTRIKNRKYPQYTVRVGEFEPGGIVHLFRWKNGKQTSKGLKCRRTDLGTTTKAQGKEARRLVCECNEDLASEPAASEATARSRAPLTLSQLAICYDLHGFAGTSAA